MFWKLLFRWKGSIYKLVWQNLLLYMVLYYALSFTYRLLLDEKGRVSNHIDKISPCISESPKPFKQGSIDMWKVLLSGRFLKESRWTGRSRQLTTGVISSYLLAWQMSTDGNRLNKELSA